jgi:hypothetical protein
MKLILMLSFLVSAGAWATGYEVRCDMDPNGILSNSQDIREIRFLTLTDIFTINNAKTLLINVNGEDLAFMRSSIEVQSDHTLLVYNVRRGRKVIRIAEVLLDRSPVKAITDRQYFGHLTIYPEGVELDSINRRSPDVLTYNFHCRI